MKIRINTLMKLMKVGSVVFLLVGLVSDYGCGRRAVKQGDKLKLEYRGTLEDGGIFDQSKEGAPSEYIVGSGGMIPAFENALIGMKVNEEKEINLRPEEAFGYRSEDLIWKFSRKKLRAPFEPKVGMVVSVPNPMDPMGRQVPVKIIDINEDIITVDRNHPLAGKSISYYIKIIDIE